MASESKRTYKSSGETELPELKFPPADYSRENSEIDLLRSNTFVHAFDGYASKSLSGKEFKYTTTITADYFRVKVDEEFNMAKEIGRLFDKVKEGMAESMQDYIIEHNGVIDSWFNPVDTLYTNHSTGKRAHHFSYFSDFYPPTQKNIHDWYVYPGTLDYRDAKDKEDELYDKYRKAKNEEKGFLAALLTAGGLYLSIGALTVLGDLIFHIGRFIDPFFEKFPGLGTVLDLPYIIHSLIFGIFGEIDVTRAAVFCSALLAGACLLVAGVLFAETKRLYNNSKNYHKAKKEYFRHIKSKEFKKLMKEYKVEANVYETFALKWHQEWFKWLVKVGYIQPLSSKHKRKLLKLLK